MEQRMMRPNAAPTRGRRAARRRPLTRLVLALFAALMLATLPAASPHGVLPIVSAHNLNQRMVYLFFDPATKALLDARIPTLTPPEPLLQVGDEIGM
ncbi:MAG: hypothetical protein KDH92_01955, partial [Chloroflexi bacterium]|nr:hypothetical protein [Chloroflexota bacterium]